MADLSKVLLLIKERVNCMESKTLKTQTKVNTVRGRSAVRELYERSIYERTVMSELSIEGYAISNQLFTVKLRRHYRVFRRDREPSNTSTNSEMSEEQEQKTKGICLQAYCSKYTKVFQAAMLHPYEG